MDKVSIYTESRSGVLMLYPPKQEDTICGQVVGFSFTDSGEPNGLIEIRFVLYDGIKEYHIETTGPESLAKRISDAHSNGINFVYHYKQAPGRYEFNETVTLKEDG